MGLQRPIVSLSLNELTGVYMMYRITYLIPAIFVLAMLCTGLSGIYAVGDAMLDVLSQLPTMY